MIGDKERKTDWKRKAPPLNQTMADRGRERETDKAELDTTEQTKKSKPQGPDPLRLGIQAGCTGKAVAQEKSQDPEGCLLPG